MNDKRKKEIRIAADDFRKKCPITNYGITNLFRCCENADYRIIRYPLENSSLLGFTIKRGGDIVIYTNSYQRLSRELFTLAHEIGHAILHIGILSSFLDDSASISGKITEEMELEANYFATNLLIPEDEIKKYLDLEIEDYSSTGLNVLDIARIMSEFNVSFEMVLNRLENLGLLSKHDRLKLDTEKTIKKVGNLLNSVGGNRDLNNQSNIIDLPHQYLEYAIYNYNHNAIPKETLEKILGYYKLNIDDISDQLTSNGVDWEKLDLDEMIGGL